MEKIFGILLVITILIVLLAILIPHGKFVFQQTKTMLEGIIPSLTQAEKLSLEQGFKALHVSVHTPTLLVKELIVYEFHPTNEGALGRKHLSGKIKLELSPDVRDNFFLKKFETDNCYVFTTFFEEGTIFHYIDSWIYKGLPGSKILQSSEKLTSNLVIENEGCDPQEECKDTKPGEFTVCRDYYTGILDFAHQKAECAKDEKDKQLKEQNFSTATDKCVYEEEGCPYIGEGRDCCALAKLETNQHVYKPAYNIICGKEQGSNEARWYACTDKQHARIEANGVQFSCKNGEWKVESGGGVQILNPQIRYFKYLGVDKQTELKFVLANNQNDIELKGANIKIDVTNSDKDCYFGPIKNDDDTKTINCGDIKPNGICNFDFDNFCWKAKTFSVEVSYTGGSMPFKINCGNPDPDTEDVWFNCETNKKPLYFIGSTTPPVICKGKTYAVKLHDVDKNLCQVVVKEIIDSVELPSTSVVYCSAPTKTSDNNANIMLYESNYNSVNPSKSTAALEVSCA